MKIGIVHHGRWNYEGISNDGYAKILIPFVAGLLRKGQQVHIWAIYNFVEKDKSIQKATISRAIYAVQILSGDENDKDFRRLSKCEKFKPYSTSGIKQSEACVNFVLNAEEFYKQDNSSDLFDYHPIPTFPEDIDAVIMMIAGNISCLFPRLAIMYHYVLKNKPVFIWDGDAQAKTGYFYTLLNNPRIALEAIRQKVVCLCPSDFLEEHQKHHKNVETLHFPYPEDEIKLENKPWKYDVSYIGNEYDRQEAFKRIYGNITEHNVNIFGNWEEKLCLKNIKYHGGIPPSQVKEILAQSLASIQIVRPSYATLGYMTLRMVEVPAYTSILLADQKIRNIESRLTKDFIVKDGLEAQHIIHHLRGLSAYDRCEIVKEQRLKAKKFILEKVVNQFLEYVQKYSNSKIA